MRKKIIALLAKIIPVFLSLFFVVVVIEIFSRWLYGKPTMHFGVEMWKYANKLKVRAENAEMSHRHRPNAGAFLMGVPVKINSLGLRNHEISAQKPAGAFRVVVLGDSTTLGWGVHAEKTYPFLIEKNLNADPPSPRWKNYEVLNTGVGNYNTAQEVASLKERWLALAPDEIWIAWYINDAEPTPQPSRNWIAYHSYAWVLATTNIDNQMRRWGAIRSYRDYYNGLYAADQPGWKKCQAAFAELAAICKTRNLPLHILLIPELHTLSGDYEFKHIHDLIRAVGAKLDVPVLDLLEAFPSGGDPRRFWVSPDDAHPNEDANELMAAKIERTLRVENWIQ